MLTNLFTKEHAARRPSGITMPSRWTCLSSSPAYTFTLGGNLGQQATNVIDNRRIRQ
jgi:hypothetical protein